MSDKSLFRLVNILIVLFGIDEDTAIIWVWHMWRKGGCDGSKKSV